MALMILTLTITHPRHPTFHFYFMTIVLDTVPTQISGICWGDTKKLSLNHIPTPTTPVAVATAIAIAVITTIT